MTRSHKFAFIKARWHADIVDRSQIGFERRLQELEEIYELDVFQVPGAFELPLLAKRLAKSGRYDAIAAAAFVVDGGIYRHDFVAQSVVSGLMQVGLETDVPILSVSLTPHNFQETDEHREFFLAHFVKKGAEAADAALQVAKAGADLSPVSGLVAA